MERNSHNPSNYHDRELIILNLHSILPLSRPLLDLSQNTTILVQRVTVHQVYMFYPSILPNQALFTQNQTQ